MNTCPVCEAPATARVCEVCGHALADAHPQEAPVVPLPDLDVAVPPVGPVLVQPFPELEPTRFAPADVVPDWSENEFEPNTVPKAPDVVAGGLAELDTGREAPTPERTAPPLESVTCRYCRNVQVSGLLCDRCGMRLPWGPRLPTAKGPPLDPDVLVRCQACGQRTYQRERCASCGAVLTSAS